MKKFCVFVCVVCLLGSLALPAYAAEVTDAVTVPATDIMLEFFPTIFESIISIFECKPLLYLFSIFILAFVILIFKVATKI